jgi:DNA excision repair protein ERCC-1
MDELDDSFNDVLANMEMPELPPTIAVEEPSTSSSSSAAETAVKPPIQQQQSKYPNAIQVNPKQRGNPILKSITNIPWEFNDGIIPDYIVGKTACVLFLSIRYHNLKPDYIHERLKQLGKNFELRVLLVHIDVKEPHNALKHITRICLLADHTLMLAWTPEEAGKIIETYKMYENRPPDLIMERTDKESNHQKVSCVIFSCNNQHVTSCENLFGSYRLLML